MARSAAQNDSFCRAKRAVFACRMSHFESPKNVKKTQVACSQRFRTFSYFARTRPSAFYFGKMACISYNKCYFVSIIQHLQSHQLQREKTTFLHHFLIPNWRLFSLDAVDGVLVGILPALVGHGQHGDQRDEQEGHQEQQGRDGGADGKAFEPVLAH